MTKKVVAVAELRTYQDREMWFLHLLPNGKRSSFDLAKKIKPKLLRRHKTNRISETHMAWNRPPQYSQPLCKKCNWYHGYPWMDGMCGYCFHGSFPSFDEPHVIAEYLKRRGNSE